MIGLRWNNHHTITQSICEILVYNSVGNMGWHLSTSLAILTHSRALNSVLSSNISFQCNWTKLVIICHFRHYKCTTILLFALYGMKLNIAISKYFYLGNVYHHIQIRAFHFGTSGIYVRLAINIIINYQAKWILLKRIFEQIIYLKYNIARA